MFSSTVDRHRGLRGRPIMRHACRIAVLVIATALALTGTGRTLATASADTPACTPGATDCAWHGVVVLKLDDSTSTMHTVLSNQYRIESTGAVTTAANWYLELDADAPPPPPCSTIRVVSTGSGSGSDEISLDVEPVSSDSSELDFFAGPSVGGSFSIPLTNTSTDNCGASNTASGGDELVAGQVSPTLAGVSASAETINTMVTETSSDALSNVGIAVDGGSLGFGAPYSGTATALIQLSRLYDTDGDGCSDDYELTHNLDMFDPSDCSNKPVFDSQPQSVEVHAPAGSTAATVTYTSPTAHDLNGGVPVTCGPASGSVFPIGTTTVTCTASGSSGTATTQFAVIVDPPVTPPPPPPGGCGVGAHGATASPEYTARVSIPVAPDLQLYDFSVGFSYCWTGTTAKILHVFPLGSVGTGPGVAALEAIGFTPTFDTSSQFLAGANANATGNFSMKFAAGQLILNLGLDAAAQKLVLEELVPALDTAISQSKAGQRIDRVLQTTLARIGVNIYTGFVSAANALAGRLPGQLGRQVAEALDIRFLGDLAAAEARISAAAEALVEKGTSGDAVGKLVIQQFESAFDSITTWSFPTWTPTISFHVNTNGTTSVSEAGFANPFLTITRKA